VRAVLDAPAAGLPITHVVAFQPPFVVDELRIITSPVILGTGRRLVESTPDKSAWRFTQARPVGDSVLITIHERWR
jgi:riboflavin biosynthesis pyrimidine reductase